MEVRERVGEQERRDSERALGGWGWPHTQGGRFGDPGWSWSIDVPSLRGRAPGALILTFRFCLQREGQWTRLTGHPRRVQEEAMEVPRNQEWSPNPEQPQIHCRRLVSNCKGLRTVARGPNPLRCLFIPLLSIVFTREHLRSTSIIATLPLNSNYENYPRSKKNFPLVSGVYCKKLYSIIIFWIWSMKTLWKFSSRHISTYIICSSFCLLAHKALIIYHAAPSQNLPTYVTSAAYFNWESPHVASSHIRARSSRTLVPKSNAKTTWRIHSIVCFYYKHDK